MHEERERRIRARAHAIWEAQGRPEGQELEHWREAERQVADEEGGARRPSAQDERQNGTQVGIAAGPLINPELIAPGEDLAYAVAGGPQEMPGSPAPQPEIPVPPTPGPDLPSPEIPTPSPTPDAPPPAAKAARGARKGARGKGRGKA